MQGYSSLNFSGVPKSDTGAFTACEQLAQVPRAATTHRMSPHPPSTKYTYRMRGVAVARHFSISTSPQSRHYTYIHRPGSTGHRPRCYGGERVTPIQCNLPRCCASPLVSSSVTAHRTYKALVQALEASRVTVSSGSSYGAPKQANHNGIPTRTTVNHEPVIGKGQT